MNKMTKEKISTSNLLILDTDAASVLAKAELVKDFLRLYSETKVVITPKVEDELERPLDHGYGFPNKILKENHIDTVNISKEEKELYRKWFDEITIGKGELESISVAKQRKGSFFTMDKIAAKTAKNKGVNITAFDSIMREMLNTGIIDKKKAERAIDKIQEKDNRKIEKEKIVPTD